MDLAKEIFISTDLVGLDSGLHNISVFEDWQATYDSEPLGLTPIDALCLSALMSLQGILTTTEVRDEKILQLHEEAAERGMDLTEFYAKSSLQYHDRVRRSEEHTILKENSRLYPYIYSLGIIGAKRLLFCSNVQVIDSGLQAIENLFPDADDEEQQLQGKLLKEFLKEYRRRESSGRIEQENNAAFISAKIINRVREQKPEHITKQTTQQTTKLPKPIKKTKPNRDNYTPVSDKREQKDYIAEVRGKYSPIAEYLNLAKAYIYNKPIGDKISKNDLEKLVRDQGYIPNLADIDVLLLEFSKGGVIKKTFDMQENSQSAIVFVRFNLK